MPNELHCKCLIIGCVPWHGSFEYCLKWKSLMNTRHTSKLNKACKNLQKSSSPKEDVIQRKCRSKRRRMGLSKPEAGNTTTNTDERSVSDIINLMERKQVKVVDKGLDESDEDYGSINSSIASGPSLHYVRDLEKLRTSQDLCSSCLKLYRKAKKMRAPIKDTLLDNSKCSSCFVSA